MSRTRNKYESCAWKVQCRANELFAIVRVENNEYCLLINILNIQREQKKELRNINSMISTYISYQGSGSSMQVLDDFEIICYDSKIYVPQSLLRRVLDW